MTRPASVEPHRTELKTAGSNSPRWEVMAMVAAGKLPAQLERLLAPVVTDAGLDLESVDVTPAGRRRVLRVVVDRDGGIDLDGVADLSHAVSAALDASDVMGGQPYVLEVTSPGTDRPLTHPRHWRRAVGRLVKVDLADGSTRTARVLAAAEDGAELEDGPVSYAEVRRARVEVEFSRLDPAEEAEVAAEFREQMDALSDESQPGSDEGEEG